MADPTLEALRVIQVGLEAVKGTCVLTMDTQPTANDTITIGDIVYTWVASGASSGQINVGADLAAAKLSLVAAINGTDSIQASPNPYVTAAAFISSAMTVTARNPGPIVIATTETFTAGTNVWNHTAVNGGAMAQGSAVAATMRLAYESFDFGNDFEKIYNPQVQNGVIWETNEPGVPVQHGGAFSLKEQAAFWQTLPFWLCVQLGVPVITAPSGLAGPFLMTWTLGPATFPTPYSFTLERKRDNGAGGTIQERATNCMLPEMGFSFAVNEPLKMKGDKGFARAFATMGGGITGALTLPDIDTMKSALSTIYHDTLFSNVGDTLLADEVIGWSILLRNGRFPRYTAEGRTALDFTFAQMNPNNRGVDIDETCLLDPTTYATEVTRAATPSTNRFAVRVKAIDDQDADRILTIDAMEQHTAPLPPIGQDEGSETQTFTLKICPTSTDALVVTLSTPDLPVFAA